MKGQIHQLARKVLPSSVKRRIVSWGTKLDREAFVEKAYEIAYAPNMELRLRDIAQRGLNVRHVVDIGAFQGDWSKMARRIWPEARITMIEANLEKELPLGTIAQQIGAHLRMTLLGPEDGREVVFHVMESGSSVLPENSPLDPRIETRTMQRLDSLFPEGGPDFVKLDVQGFELEVLKGADKILEGVNAVLMEVALIEINAGAPLMAEAIGFMRERAFEVCDILEIHRRPLDHATNQVDLLFVPRTSPLLADKRHFSLPRADA